MSTRREVLAGLVGTAAVVGTGIGPARAAAPFGPGPRSGLPWHSGCSHPNRDALAALRNRPHDTIAVWTSFRTWQSITTADQLWLDQMDPVKNPGRISVAMAMLPSPLHSKVTPGVWAKAALGVYDMYYRAFAQKLADSRRTDFIVRIGWEHNLPVYPWFSGPDKDNYKITFAKIAGFIREKNPTVLIDWNGNKRGETLESDVEHYPGDDVVDIISRDFYDEWPALLNQKIWKNSFYSRKDNGQPRGLGAWFEYARSRNKLFAVPEWGIRVGQTGGTSTDNPFYFEKMFEFFSTNSTYIAFENYFNTKTESIITTPNVNPLSSAAYKRLWGRPI